MGWIRRLWQNIVAFHNGRLISSITSFTKEQHEQELATQFEKAKRLSDFVGIIIRWSFVMFATLYFLRRYSLSENIFIGLLYFLCGWWAGLMTIYFSVRVQIIVLLWWSDSVPMHSSMLGKRISLALSILFTGVGAFGIYQLVSDVARASALLPK